MNNRWVKSQKVVNFPFKDFDPTPYLASVPQETILRHKELLEHQKSQPNDQPDEDVIESANHRHNIGSIQENGILAESGGVVPSEQATKQTTPTTTTVKAAFDQDQRRRSVTNHNGISPTKRGGGAGAAGGVVTAGGGAPGETGTGRRKRLVSTSLTKTPVIDGEFTDFHNHRLVESEDPYDLNYQLYAVVVSVRLINHHKGISGGWEYIAYKINSVLHFYRVKFFAENICVY